MTLKNSLLRSVILKILEVNAKRIIRGKIVCYQTTVHTFSLQVLNCGFKIILHRLQKHVD